MLPIRLLFCVLFFAILSTLFSQRAYAACTLQVIPQSLDAYFDGDITITSTGGDCFSTTLQYWVIAYPNISEYPRALFSSHSKTPPGQLVRATSRIEIKTQFQLFQYEGGSYEYGLERQYYGILGRNFPGQWNFAVCNPPPNSQGLKDCYNSSYFLGTGTVTVQPDATPPTPTITPTPLPSDLPRIDRNTQDICTFQAGTEARILRIENMQPNQEYVWWWDGETLVLDSSNRVFTNPNTTATPFTIPSTATTGQSIRKFCVDLHRYGYSRGCGVNSINLWFKAGQPPANETSCAIVNTTPTPTPTPTPVPPTPFPPAPPCSRFAAEDGRLMSEQETNDIKEDIKNGRFGKERKLKCAEVETALVTIQTDPIRFVKSLMGILLSLAGGVALLFIIGSGYKIMTSQGNQEKLQEARDTITSAIVGLLFIILSMVILEVIGVDILRIPGFQ